MAAGEGVPALAPCQLGAAFGFSLAAALWALAAVLAPQRKDDKLPVAEDPKAQPAPKSLSIFKDNALVRCLRLERAALAAHRTTFRAWTELGAIMGLFYLCDRSQVLGVSTKSYERDTFAFICLAVLAHGWASSMGASKHTGYLNRDQTEEWKGIMQVLFLLYHYFEAREVYNWIRVFIAAYVWMTGFGNFSYYYIRQDFTMGRFAQMMWRLNFFVFVTCASMNNSYMLYYICPMHTLFTLFLYGALRVKSEMNSTNVGVAVKIGGCVALVMGLWEFKEVFYAVWTPLLPLVGYVNPAKPDGDPMHEWFFRSGLDRYVWIYGMLVAYMHPWVSRQLECIDNMQKTARYAVTGVILAVALGVGKVWWDQCLVLEKFDYNAVHPFTSWVPITLWIVLRNLLPSFRGHHMEFFAFLGRITLETYICQFHIWLHSGVPNAQPGKLLEVVPGYPLLNFMVVTVGYVFVAMRAFDITNTLKKAHVPAGTGTEQQLAANVVTGAVLFAALYVAGLVLYEVEWLSGGEGEEIV